MANPKAPLEGLVVVAVEQAVAAPFCSARLADAGAEVIKIERREGDFARGYDDVAHGQSSYFVWLNRGKKSVVIDLHTGDGQAALKELVAPADVFLHNLKPGALDKLGLGMTALRGARRDLITCSISGYGEVGPGASRKAYDLLIQAESGLSSITGGPEAPARVGISVVDIATGASAHAAILEALIARRETGEGADIQVSMFQVMAEWLTVPLLHAEGGRNPMRLGLAHPSIAPYGVFTSADDRQIIISIQSDREWRGLASEVLGNPGLGGDPRFATNLDRVRNRAETDSLVSKAFVTRTRLELLEALAQADIAFAEVNDMAALSEHALLRRIEVGTAGGPVAMPAPGVSSSGAPRRYGRVPRLGEHQRELLGRTVEPAPGRADP